MLKKFTNKSKNKEYRSPLYDFNPQCSMCKKRSDKVKYRKMYDYINGIDDYCWLCDDCEWKIIADSELL